MIENGFVYAVNVAAEKERKRKIKRDKKMSKLYDICRKYNKTLDELDKNELTKAEYKIILGCFSMPGELPPIEFYSNLS